MTEEQRMIITRIERGETKSGGKPVVEMYVDHPGFEYPELRLFDLSQLLAVGIDPNTLEEGEEQFVRFFAYYTVSDRLNKEGNPYKDVTRLERIGAPATASSVDNSAIVEELRAIRRLLELVLFEGKAGPHENVGASISNGDQAVESTSPIKPTEPQEMLLPAHPESSEPAGALNEDQARRQFGKLAGPAVRAKQIPAGMPRQLTIEVTAGAKSWRDALVELESEIDSG